MPGRSLPHTTPDWEAAVRRQTAVWLVVALLLTALIAVLAYQAWQGRLPRTEARQPVVFATRDLEPGTLILADMVEVRPVPPEVIPEGAFPAVEAVVGKQALYPIARGEILTETKVGLGPQGSVLARKCPGGFWCASLPETWFVATPPQIVEGDRIDVVGARPKQPFEDTVFLAEDVPVIGVGQDEEGRRFVLALDAQESLSLLYAHVNDYRLWLLLRSAQAPPELPPGGP